MSRPTLTVVLPNFNHARYLPAAIDAFLNQTRPPDEFLILDDASTDDSVEIIQSYARRHPSIQFLQNDKNAGVILANARLFMLATGDYIHPAAADDDRFPTFLERALEMAARYPEAGLIFGQNVFQNEAGIELETVAASRWQTPRFAPPETYRKEFLEAELASHSLSQATIYRRAPFLEVGGYRPELGSWADTFAARAIGLKYGACYVPEKFSISRRLAGSYSQSSKDDPRRMLDIIARAARLMRSPEFRDRFPADHVRRWVRQYRWLVIWNDWLGDSAGPDRRRPPFLLRNLYRLPRTWRSLKLAAYRPKPT